MYLAFVSITVFFFCFVFFCRLLLLLFCLLFLQGTLTIAKGCHLYYLEVLCALQIQKNVGSCDSSASLVLSKLLRN